MKVIEIVEKLGLEVFSGVKGLENRIEGGYVSDLLSDVMGNASENQIWITVQTHPNIVAVASLKELAAIILVKGLKPDDSTIEKGNTENIPILGSQLQAFELAGRMFSLINAV
jgi:predicted transcriptional regulator